MFVIRSVEKDGSLPVVVKFRCLWTFSRRSVATGPATLSGSNLNPTALQGISVLKHRRAATTSMGTAYQTHLDFRILDFSPLAS
jgi:hypothetical protein